MTANELNLSCIERLKSLDLTKYVVVVGSGPSSPYISSNDELQKLLCKRCGIQKNGTEMFWALAQRAFEANQDEYYLAIKESFGSPPYWQAQTYDHIATIGFRGYITFNYDKQLPEACRRAMGDAFASGFTVHPPRQGLRSADASDFMGIYRQVYCIHGYCDSRNPKWHEEIILKTSDYDLHYTYQASNQLFRFWKNLLVQTSCIFIGTSLEEPGLYKVFEDLRRQNPEALRQNQHLHLLPYEIDPDKKYPPARRSLGAIEHLRYDKLDNRYSGLIQILGEFSGLPTEGPSPMVPAPTPISATNDFNFYNP